MNPIKNNESNLIENEWNNFCILNDFFQQAKNFNPENYCEIKNESILATNQRYINLYLQLKKQFDEKILKIINESRLNLDDINEPTFQNVINKCNQTSIEYHRLKTELEGFKNQTHLLDELKNCKSQVELLKNNRDNLLKMIDSESNEIEKKTSKLCFRTHENALVACKLFFNFNSIHLLNFFLYYSGI